VSRLEVGDRDAVVAVAFSPDGHYVAAGVDDMTARVFEALGGKEVARVLLGNTVRMVAFSPNGRYLAAGALGWDGGVKVFEAPGGREVSRVEVDDSDAADAAFSPNGRYIAVGSNDTVRVFEALGGR
jgi:WD40 repeat protein